MSVDASDLLGIPFKLGGRDRDGIDCLGVALEVARRAGLNVRDPWDILADYYPAPFREVPQLGGWVPATSPWQPGDIASINAGTHVAVCCSPGLWMTALDPVGPVFVREHRARDGFDAVYRWSP